MDSDRGHPARPGVGRVLLVEDDPDQAAILEAFLSAERLDVAVADTGEHALELHRRKPADVLVTDLQLPGMSGLDLIRRLVAPERAAGDTSAPPPPPAVVVVTGAASVGTAIEALKLGAADYLQKPVEPGRLLALVRTLVGSGAPLDSDADSDIDDPNVPSFEGMVGVAPVMRQVFDRIERVARTMAPVLVLGESGTGKELVSRAVHRRSGRAAGPFVPVHTGAIPRELIASELFGHEKGSFTGAFSAAEGKFEAAAGGSIFLDEVGTMDEAVQVSLLRVLETYRFTRVGGRKELEADVRVIAATNKDLLDLVDDHQFREDLYYRLNVFTILIPPLRERREDILPIAQRYLRKFAARYATPARRFSDAAVARLNAYDWPGNVRELRNAIEQTAVFAGAEVVEPDALQLGGGRIERRGRARASSVGIESEPTPPPSGIQSAADSAFGTTQPHPAPTSAASGSGPAAPPSTRSETETAPSPPVIAVPPAPPESVTAPAPAPAPAPAKDEPFVLRLPVGTRLADAERQLILMTLEALRGNKQRTARVLGISRRGLYSKLQSYGEDVRVDAEGTEPEPEGEADGEGAEEVKADPS
ncbi:MAG: sigma-54 dependent transcriptional regulator [Polyangiaceae bacterium]